VFFAACQTKNLKYRGEDIELYNKPLQKPYPPLWFPSSNKESIEFTAKHGYHTAFLGTAANCRAHYEQYREIWQRHRSDPGRHNAHVAEPFLAKTQHLVIADTEADAEKIGLKAHATWASHIHHLTRKAGRPDVHKTEPYAPDSAQPLIAGTPRSVIPKLKSLIEETGINYLLCIFSFGDIAPGHAMRSLELFSREIQPHVTA
jgi:alkanesulfonate monooxygenase SsuD/methylene tetrahydromethanopterin reductase-like flavin-dependent oxidoreductase (luciferase family)